ncbi:DNA binding domain-containing protein, excisionase family [Cnuella takakiae]|uniref:DNA binding domain-containing protein, excisionase family n=1 Tax=Cnuella takakiae TaxID=1302690 RepID=A0A1M5EL37_9BACT|nr:helix-turn-helix domain-containing protein [Cnuella takakiae]OLY91218.1 hypothetical protein BUE76_04360 [Cnuella takakiae]SHF79998.1 DNA binding domain-containing protein, excisionase family [Cnuella takakiae]
MDNFILSPISLDALQSSIAACVKKEVEAALEVNARTKSKDDFISRKDAAKLLSISLPTLHEWTKNGTIPAYRVGKFVRYKSTEVSGCMNKIRTSLKR